MVSKIMATVVEGIKDSPGACTAKRPLGFLQSMGGIGLRCLNKLILKEMKRWH